MSLFKKSKKNIRRRNLDSEDDDSVEVMEVDVGLPSNGVKKSKNKERSAPTKATLLSFAGDEEENVEVFQVKKSSYSKKIKILNRERRKKNEKSVDEEVVQNAPSEVKLETEDLVLVVNKKEEEQARNLILNGRAALAAGREDVSSEEDEGSIRYKFSQSNRPEINIESGKIPDAATIHAARKRRERARLLNTNDVIPLETPKAHKTQPKTNKSKSRLLREEDEVSDEERVTMGTGLEANDMSARRADYFETVDHGPEVEVEPVQQGSWTETVPQCQLLPPPPPPTAIYSKELATPTVLTQKLRDRLAMLKEVHSGHCADVIRVETELGENVAETQRLEGEAPQLAAKFRFYQDMRGYVTDLVECLDEKVPGLLKLEESARKLWAERSNYFAGRRRLDVRDQADEMSQWPKNSTPRWSKEEEEARGRRAAEREGRRTRRRRARELRRIATPHVEGMSSDDEDTELEASTFNVKIEEIQNLGSGLLQDVETEFGTVHGVAARMEKWREFDITAYTEAYASLCVPKLLGPLVRFNLLTWNPIQTDAIELENMEWWGRLLTFGLSEDETMTSLANDPDILLLPVLIEKAIVPNITDLVQCFWDPLSSSQTQRLVNFINKYVADMPGMSPKSADIKKLIEAVLARLKHAVDNDVFIPITFIGGEARGGGNPVFFQRQFASTVKLLRNTLSFQGLISTEALHEIALDSLLNRYLLAAMRICQPSEAISKANTIISTFPRWWFQTETKIPKLDMFARHLKQLLAQISSETESFELASNLLKTLQLSCSDIN